MPVTGSTPRSHLGSTPRRGALSGMLTPPDAGDDEDDLKADLAGLRWAADKRIALDLKELQAGGDRPRTTLATKKQATNAFTKPLGGQFNIGLATRADGGTSGKTTPSRNLAKTKASTVSRATTVLQVVGRVVSKQPAGSSQAAAKGPGVPQRG